MAHVLVMVVFLLLSDERGGSTSAQHDRAESACLTREAIEARLTELARDEWRGVTAQVATGRWPDLRAIGYHDRTKLPVLYQRGVTEQSGEPRCVERYSFALSQRGAHREPVLNEVEVVHRETDREKAISAATAFLDAIVPTPRPGPSSRMAIDEHERGKRVFRADYGWVRSAESQ
jgi:hypothetical protein